MQELTASMSSSEYASWLDYAAVEPWGCQPADLRAAIVACTVARSQGARVELQDFLPPWARAAEPAEPISVAELKRRFMAVGGG